MSSTSVLVAPSKNREIYMPYDVYRVREDFPILKQIVHGKPLIYLDNAASTQKPQVVIDAISDTYQKYYANIHRGVHWLSQKSTELYEQTRESARLLVPLIHGSVFSSAMPPKGLIWWRIPTGKNLFSRAMKSSSPPWNIIPTSSLADSL